MGFHLHFDVGTYSVPDLSKVCQQFIKYEHVIDTMMPLSRRTGSTESGRFFRSNTEHAKETCNTDEEGVLKALGTCRTYGDLADIMNPGSTMHDRRYFKLNLQNLITGRQSTIEFRQHSSTANHEKVDAWVRFIVRFCENSVGLERPASFPTTPPRSVDAQFDDLFKVVIRDSVLHSYYRDRRHLLSVDVEGEACCHGCATGHGCTK